MCESQLLAAVLLRRREGISRPEAPYTERLVAEAQ